MFSIAFLAALTECLKQFDSTASDPVTAANLVERVMAFQERHGKLFVDGKLGPKTLWALQFPLLKAANNGAGQLMELVTLRSDPAPAGYSHLDPIVLREDASEAFGRIMAKVREKGGKIIAAGGLRRLDEPDGPNRSAASFHYPGLAVDLSPYAGARNPAKDPYVCELSDANRWTVWARAEGGEERELNAIACTRSETAPNGGPRPRGIDYVTIERKKVTGKFVNLTGIALAEGYHAIGPRPSFANGPIRNFMSSEWWHFQYEKPLVEGFSMFGIELARLKRYHNTNSLTGSSPWNERNRIFGNNWN